MSPLRNRYIGLFLLAWIAWPVLADGERTKPIVGLPTEADGKQLWYHEIIRILNETVAANAQNMILIADHCFAGGALDAVGSAGNRVLQGTFSIAVSTASNAEKITQYHFDPGVRSKNDPLSLVMTEGAHDGLDGFGPQWIKHVRDDTSVKMKDAFTRAAKDDIFGPKSKVAQYRGEESPAYDSTGAAADNATLKSGTTSNHAILFMGNDLNLYDRLMLRELNNRLVDKYNYRRANENDPSQGDIQLLLDDYNNLKHWTMTDAAWEKATKPNFETAVTNLKAAFAANPNKEQLLLYFGGHGKQGKATDKLKSGALPGQPGQGTLVNAADPTLLMDTDPAFWANLLWTVGFNAPGFWRTRPPALSLATYEEFVSGDPGLTIGVRVDPQTFVPLAQFTLAGTSQPSYYEVPIGDPALLALYNAFGSIPPSQLALEFQFADPQTALRLYTQEDYALQVDPTVDLWGVGLASSLAGSLSDYSRLVTLDQGLGTGSVANCLPNTVSSTNYADTFQLAADTPIIGAVVWVCQPWNKSDDMTVQFWADAGGLPGGLLASAEVELLTPIPDQFNTSLVELSFPPVTLPAATPLWFGATSAGQSLGQVTLAGGPGDGQLAQQSAQAGDWTLAPQGDMAFQLICRDPCLGGLIGDSNCDGTVNFRDINCFAAAIIGGEAAWNACGPNPGCRFLCVIDINGDGAVDFGDINPFVDLLSR